MTGAAQEAWPEWDEGDRTLDALKNKLEEFFRLESAGGILLMSAAVLALAMENSPLAGFYESMLQVPIEVRVGALQLAKPALLWINDGLMAIFFLLVGLEIKREMFEGELSRADQVVLPAAAAVGGFVVPAAIYALINRDHGPALNGWAIPSATDIAFALGILGALGNRVPLALKVFLTTVAIFDDLGAIVVIAIFYSADLGTTALTLAALFTMALIVLNRLRVVSKVAYALLGIALWISVLKSGVHATLAGIIVAFALPFRDPKRPEISPVRDLEHALHPWVAFGILPVFAFANAGVPLLGLSADDLVHPVPVGIALGLFVGKQLGVFTTCVLLIKLGLARLPEGVDWMQLYGASVLTGIGFTMSLFIGSLAFEHSDFDYGSGVRIGVLAGSILSAVLGYLILARRAPSRKNDG